MPSIRYAGAMQKGSGNFLGIDTALGATSVALWSGGRVVAEHYQAGREQQASRLLRWVEATLAEAGIGYADLEGVVASVGPGGFTGIRVGLAAARGIGFAAKLPVSGFSTLQLMAYGVRAEAEEVTAILPAGREQVFLQHFRAMEAEEPQLLARSELPALKTLVTTLPELPAERALIHDVAKNAALLVEMRASGVQPLMPSTPSPLYIKPPDATPGQPLLERLASSQLP